MASFPHVDGNPVAGLSGVEADPVTERSRLEARIAELERQVQVLSESEERYRSMIRQSTEGIWRIEHEEPIPVDLPIEVKIECALKHARLAECNDALARMYGLERAEQMVGIRLSDVFDPNAETTRSYLRAFFENGHALHEVDSIERDLNGQRKIFRNSLVGLIENGCLVRAWGTQRDVTESREAARQLEFQRSFLRTVIESIPSLIFVKDEDGCYVLANEATARVYGVSVQELEGRHDGDFRSEEDVAEFQSVDREVLATGKDVGPYELRLFGADGTKYWLETTKRPIPGAEPGKWLVLGVCNDITERRENEQELLKIRQAIDSARDAISITDLGGLVTYANPAFERILGYSLNELKAVGGPKDLYAVESEFAEVYEAINRGGSFEGEVTFRHRDGGLVAFHQRIDLIRAADGTEIGILGVRTDVAEKRRLEAQLRQAEKLAALGELVAGVAHELNNPMATISAHAQMLQRSDDENVRRRAEGILRMVERTSRIGKSLLTFARDSRPTPRRHFLNDIVQESLELCGSRLRREGIVIELDLTKKSPLVLVDDSQIEQIIVNLVSNAAYAMKTVEGRTLKIETLSEGGRACVSIRDQGLGIPLEIQSRVFDPFFTTKPIGEGTGLGLPICHSLALANDGTLTFDTVPSKGTCFTLSLPLLDVSPRP